jgi:hypothetical protein
MDGPTVSLDATLKQDRTFRTVAFWVCIVAVSFGITDLIEGYHRVVSTCSSAAFTCYFANKGRSSWAVLKKWLDPAVTRPEDRGRVHDARTARPDEECFLRS